MTDREEISIVERKKRIKKENKENRDIAMRLIEFVSNDEAMKAMTPGRIKNIFDTAHGIIAAAASGVTLEQICCILVQEAKNSPQD